MNSSYRIEKTEFGIAVYGSLPVDDLTALMKIWEQQGHNEYAFDLCEPLGATAVVCSTENHAKWKAKIERDATRRHGAEQELIWLSGTDTGTSSRTIFSVMSEKYGDRALSGAPSPPSDPSDFGRCYRLLELFPAWKERLGEVTARYPAWIGLVREWEALTALYLEELPSGVCPKLYDKMKELEIEGRLADGWERVGQHGWKQPGQRGMTLQLSLDDVERISNNLAAKPGKSGKRRTSKR